MIAFIYGVELTSTADAMLAEIRDRRIIAKILDRATGLAVEPEKQGKPLTGDLAGYRSVRAVAQRYRILYRVEAGKGKVTIRAIGIRKDGDKRDIYALASRLLRLGLL